MESSMNVRRVRVLLWAPLFIALVVISIAPVRARAAGIGKVAEKTAPAEVRRAGETAWQDLALGGEIRLGDSLRTGPGGRLKLLFDDHSILILAEKSTIEVTRHVYDAAAGRRDSLFRLYEGKVRAVVEQLFSAPSEFQIESQTAVAGVKGTDFEEHYKKPCTTVYSHRGDVSARNSNPKVLGEVVVATDQLTIVCEGKAPTKPENASDEFKKGTIPLRGEGSLHPEGLPVPPGEQPPPTSYQGPPRYPSGSIDQPTQTGGLPSGPIKPPEPPKNP
jgi:ferric-dicitrate binding protein FerR (iron transport regulator)